MAVVDFSIGGVVYQAPPLSIFALRQEGVWDAVTTLGRGSSNLVEEMDKFLIILAAALSQTPSPVSLDDLRRQATLGDLRGLDASLLKLLRESGMGGDTGEAPAASPSAEAPESGTTS